MDLVPRGTERVTGHSRGSASQNLWTRIKKAPSRPNWDELVVPWFSDLCPFPHLPSGLKPSTDLAKA